MISAQKQDSMFKKPRVVFLFILGIVITVLFCWLIKGFILALLVAAILAAIVHPFNNRLTAALHGRKKMASGITVLLSLVLVIIPIVLFLGVLVSQAINISDSMEDWLNRQSELKENLQKKIEADSHLKQLLPYQDKIIEKAGQLSNTAGSFVAKGLAAGAKGTAEFFLLFFVMLYAMFYFLVEGRSVLNETLRFSPLSENDNARLFDTFTSVGRATLKGTLVIGILQGGLAGLSFWAAGIKGAVFWGAFMAVLSIIPGIGSALVWVPAVIFLVIEQKIGAAIGVGLWCAFVVGTVDNVLRPLLVGKDTQMPDLLVMLTTLGGLALLGPAGIIIGPIIGALCLTVWQLWGGAIDEIRSGAYAGATNNKEVYYHDKE